MVGYVQVEEVPRQTISTGDEAKLCEDIKIMHIRAKPAAEEGC